MGNRVFTAVVLILWSVSMSWLVVARIMPPFFQGEPPNQGSLRNQGIVCWRIECRDESVGWAVSQVVPGALDTTEIHSRVLLSHIPLKEMAPQWMASIVDNVAPIEFDLRNRVTLDSLGQLSMFDTRVRFNDLPSVIKMFGRVQDSVLTVKIQSGDISHTVKYPIPKTSHLGGELTPDAMLHGVYVGQKWQKEVYSPFRTPHHSVELLQAEVVDEQPLLIDGELINVKRVEYRTLSSTGVSEDHSLRAELWIADDGTVLRQDIYLANVRLQFNRMQDEASIAHAIDLLDLEKYATVDDAR